MSDITRHGWSLRYVQYCMYSRTPLIRPPSESHWCGRIRGMVAREGFVYKQKALSVTRNVVVWEGWSLVRVVVRQGFYCTVNENPHWCKSAHNVGFRCTKSNWFQWIIFQYSESIISTRWYHDYYMFEHFIMSLMSLFMWKLVLDFY